MIISVVSKMQRSESFRNVFVSILVNFNRV